MRVGQCRTGRESDRGTVEGTVCCDKGIGGEGSGGQSAIRGQ